MTRERDGAGFYDREPDRRPDLPRAELLELVTAYGETLAGEEAGLELELPGGWCGECSRRVPRRFGIVGRRACFAGCRACCRRRRRAGLMAEAGRSFAGAEPPPWEGDEPELEPDA